VRTDEWKLVRHYKSNQLDELYCLRDDPGELRNRFSDAAAGETRQQLQRRLEDWMRSIDDPLIRE
jgi:hypothetical protein